MNMQSLQESDKQVILVAIHAWDKVIFVSLPGETHNTTTTFDYINILALIKEANSYSNSTWQ